MTREEEHQWVTRAQQDPAQFDTLYRAFVEEIYRFVYYKTSTREVAEDLTAQVFTQALEHLGKFRYKAGARFSSWLYAIARNQVIDYYRRHHETVDLEAAEPIRHPGSAATEVDIKMQQEQVRVIMKALPSSDQELLQLRLWEEKDYAELALLLGSNVVAVRARYSRALKKFNQLYTQTYGSLQ